MTLITLVAMADVPGKKFLKRLPIYPQFVRGRAKEGTVDCPSGLSLVGFFLPFCSWLPCGRTPELTVGPPDHLLLSCMEHSSSSAEPSRVCDPSSTIQRLGRDLSPPAFGPYTSQLAVIIPTELETLTLHPSPIYISSLLLSSFIYLFPSFKSPDYYFTLLLFFSHPPYPPSTTPSTSLGSIHVYSTHDALRRESHNENT